MKRPHPWVRFRAFKERHESWFSAASTLSAIRNMFSSAQQVIGSHAGVLGMVAGMGAIGTAASSVIASNSTNAKFREVTAQLAAGQSETTDGLRAAADDLLALLNRTRVDLETQVTQLRVDANKEIDVTRSQVLTARADAIEASTLVAIEAETRLVNARTALDAFDRNIGISVVGIDGRISSLDDVLAVTRRVIVDGFAAQDTQLAASELRTGAALADAQTQNAQSLAVETRAREVAVQLARTEVLAVVIDVDSRTTTAINDEINARSDADVQILAGLAAETAAREQTQERRRVGTVAIGDINAGAGPAVVTGDFASASKSSGGGSVVTVNFAVPMQANTYAVQVTVLSAGTNIFDNDITVPVVHNRTNGSFSIYLEETASVLQNIVLMITVEQVKDI